MDTQPEEAQQPNVQAEEAQQLNARSRKEHSSQIQVIIKNQSSQMILYQVPPTQQTPPPVYDIPPVQPGYSQEPPVNWVPVSRYCLFLAQFYAVHHLVSLRSYLRLKMNSAVTAGNMAEAKDLAV